MTYQTQDVPGFQPDDDHYIYFDGPWTSLVKTTTMFVGELEFSDIPIDPSSSLAWVSFSFLVTFVFLIVVILMNLLNGLAVSDTGVIMAEAEIVSYISRVETISYLESILLGDPFDFLTNWPPATIMAKVPALALCHKVGSTPQHVPMAILRCTRCVLELGRQAMLSLVPRGSSSSSGMYALLVLLFFRYVLPPFLSCSYSLINFKPSSACCQTRG